VYALEEMLERRDDGDDEAVPVAKSDIQMFR
jgi:hypothetical protein